MIELRQVGKSYRTRQGRRSVLSGVDLRVAPGERVGILGRNGAGKSTLIRLISGAELPSRGRIERAMSVSWPLAFGGAFQSSLTGMDNVRFVCRVYGADIAAAIGYVRDFSELGRYLDEPVRTYSSGMRARLAFALSMAVRFDCFLIDEVVAVGDSRFHERCKRELFDAGGERAIILVSHDPAYVREHCQRAAVLEQGTLFNFASVDEAFAFYQRGAL